MSNFAGTFLNSGGKSKTYNGPNGKRVYKTRPKKNPERYYYSGSYGGWVRVK